ncbi:hypothetical protein [Paraburkholderia acidipaludis]|uniref:hypothetical protein n=1 Tax=Paraburkholderia acidipaludis TaxID=660537 RepID=UPI0012EB1C49|nr:hypothetical protein [Paraburkholderia acidipaludis]
MDQLTKKWNCRVVARLAAPALRQFQCADVPEGEGNYFNNMKAISLFHVINKKVTRFCPLEFFP